MTDRPIWIVYGHLSDYAAFVAGGKPLLVGIFDQVFAHQRQPDGSIPIPTSFLAVKLAGSVLASGPRPLQIQLRDEDGYTIFNVLEVEHFELKPVGPGRPLTTLILAQLVGLSVPRVCDYEFEVCVDREKVGGVPLYVVDPPAAG